MSSTIVAQQLSHVNELLNKENKPKRKRKYETLSFVGLLFIFLICFFFKERAELEHQEQDNTNQNREILQQIKDVVLDKKVFLFFLFLFFLCFSRFLSRIFLSFFLLSTRNAFLFRVI